MRVMQIKLGGVIMRGVLPLEATFCKLPLNGLSTKGVTFVHVLVLCTNIMHYAVADTEYASKKYSN